MLGSTVSNTVAALRFRFVVRRHRTVTVLVLYRVNARQAVTFLSSSDSSHRLADVPEAGMQFLGNIRVEQKETASFLTSNSEKPETSPLSRSQSWNHSQIQPTNSSRHPTGGAASRECP